MKNLKDRILNLYLEFWSANSVSFVCDSVQTSKSAQLFEETLFYTWQNFKLVDYLMKWILVNIIINVMLMK